MCFSNVIISWNVQQMCAFWSILILSEFRCLFLFNNHPESDLRRLVIYVWHSLSYHMDADMVIRKWARKLLFAFRRVTVVKRPKNVFLVHLCEMSIIFSWVSIRNIVGKRKKGDVIFRHVTDISRWDTPAI